MTGASYYKTKPRTRLAGGAFTLSTVRPSITGGGTSQWDLLDNNGVSMRKAGKAPWGYNTGVFEYYSEAEADTLMATLYADGVRLVRFVGLNRTFGSPTKASGDSNRIFSPPGTDVGLADVCWNRKNPKHLHKLDVYVNALVKVSLAHPSDPMWFIVCMEGDIRQGSTQDTTWDGSFHPTTGTYDRALTLPQAGETIPGGLADWGLAGGYNVFTSKVLFAQAREEAKLLARKYRSTPYLYAFEFLSEPLPPSGKFPSSPTPPNGRASPYYIYPGELGDGVYGPEWSFRSGNPNAPAFLPGGDPNDGPPNGCLSIEEFYRTLITDVIGDVATGKPAIAPNSLFIVGGRNGYNLDPEMNEVIMALSDSTGLGGDLVGGNKIIGTWDRLGSGTNQCTKTPNTAWAAAKFKTAMFMNQLGCRNTGDGNKDVGDASTYGLRLAVRTYRSWGYGGTIWDYRGNGSGGYGSYASDGNGDGDGAGGTYTVVSPRRADLAGVFAETPAALETAAISAANACHGVLVYVKADRTNLYTTGTLTQFTTSTPLGTAIGKITPVTDPDATGIIFTPHSTGTVTMDVPWKDGGNMSYLPDKWPCIAMDNSLSTVNFLDASISFFGTTASGTTATGDEDFAAMVAFVSEAGSGVSMDLLTCGNTGTVDFYPQISCNTNNKMLAKVIGDGPSGVTLTVGNTVGTSTWSLSAGVPIVATIIKSGLHNNASVTFLVNGIDDTATVPGGYAASAVAETIAGTSHTLTAQTVAATGIASLTRLRLGGKSNTGSFTGKMAGFCLFRQAPSSAQYHAIGRWLAYLAGGGYKA